MAAKEPISVEDELRELLIEEHKRRHEFAERLQELLCKRDRELREQNTGGEEATVPDLVQRLKKVDADLTPLLQRCQQLTGTTADVISSETDDVGLTPILQQCQLINPGSVSKREKGASAQRAAEAERDSGYTTPSASADMGAQRRYATVVSRDLVETALPELADNAADSFVGNVPPSRRTSRDPVEHSDESSPDSGSSRSSPEEETHKL